MTSESTYSIHIDGEAPRRPVSPSLYGLFFEDVNHAGEGGLYAEMVLNRDFEMNTLPAGTRWAGNLLRTSDRWFERKWFNGDLHGWSLVLEGGARGSMRQSAEHPLNAANPQSLQLAAGDCGARIGVANSGFWGMNFDKEKWYELSFYARTEEGERFDVGIALESGIGHQNYATAVITGVSGEWKQYRCSLQARETERQGRLVLTVDHPGKIWFDVVSLFPRETFKGRANGMRADLAQMLADMKPAFMRFPGGAVVGGLNLDNRWKWKDTLGDIAKRKGTMNLWGYYSTHGLGYHEFLQLCEDLGADALFVCNPGMSDQFRCAEFCKPEEVEDFIQEALDALEYALGPADSKWGGERVRNGHPKPFPLRYIEIGNEAHGENYMRNYVRFYDAIRARYPDLKIISNLHAWEDDAPAAHLPGLNVHSDIVDVHFYRSPGDFFSMADYYDTADRNGPKRYFGEYGSTDSSEGNLMAALAEAAMLMGLERNSDHVIMSSYAPLFFNVNDIAYPVNLIGFDNHRVFGRTSYYVQKLLSRNRADEVLDTKVLPAASAEARMLYAMGGIDQKSGEIILKVVNRSAKSQTVTIQLKGVRKIGSQAKVVTLGSEDAGAENSITDPEAVVPVESIFDGVAERFAYSFSPYSLTLLRFVAKL